MTKVTVVYDDTELQLVSIEAVNKLHAEIKRLRHALTIYALRANWHADLDNNYAPPLPSPPITVFDADDWDQVILRTYGGEIARLTLNPEDE